MPTQATKITLPNLIITELSDITDTSAQKIEIRPGNKKSPQTYYIKSKKTPILLNRDDSNESNGDLAIPTFPLVVNKDGIPWAEANVWILTQYICSTNPKISTLRSIAGDLVDFLKFIEDKNLDWLDFDCERLFRPTYRYNAYLTFLIQSNPQTLNTSKRRMATVIRFYRWLAEICKFEFKRPPWTDRTVSVATHTYYGGKLSKSVTTTNISFKLSQQDDPYDEHIKDGGKLKPLTQKEQEWLIEALAAVGNTEMTLIHLFCLFTGARIQTALTFRFRNVQEEIVGNSQGYIRVAVGPGTGIDTKNSKRQVIHIPLWLYEKLRTYAYSDRAKERRLKAAGGDVSKQYLFLSQNGTPFYDATTQLPGKASSRLRHTKSGQAVQQFKAEKILPYIHQKFDTNFHYKLHDLRASFGMNMVDDKMELVKQGKLTVDELYEYVRVRMGHESLRVTDLYVNYRKRLSAARVVQDGWEAALELMARKAMGGSNE